MPTQMGGIRITGYEWLSSHALSVRFVSGLGTTHHYQLYAGRTLIGFSDSPSQRFVNGQLHPALWPEHITLLAVDPVNQETAYGHLFPDRPFNKARLRFTASGWPADARYIDLLAGLTPGGAVDQNNRLERIEFDTNRRYELFSPPMPGSGTWNFEVRGRDDKKPSGNVGSALAASVGLLAHPPDVPLRSDGSRFAVSTNAGNMTVTFTEAP